jgi:hypothetical protein
MPYYKPIKDIKDQAEKVRLLHKLLLLRKDLDKELPKKTVNDTLLLAT